MTTRKYFTMMAIAIIALAIIGCKQEPTPVPQSKTTSFATNGGTVNVTVNYTALPGIVPGYMPTLEYVFIEILKGTNVTGNLTINVISGLGIEGFTNAAAGSLNVDASWLASATEYQMGTSMNSKTAKWIGAS
jgi:hypothetical protein